MGAAPVWVYWAGLAVSTAATVYSQQQQAKAIKSQNEQQKTANTIDSNSREIARKQRLLKALASQNNKAGAGGIRASEGSIANISTESIANDQLGQMTDDVRLSTQNQALDMSSKTAQRTARISMVSTIGDAAMTSGTIGRVPSGGLQEIDMSKLPARR